MKKGKIPSNSTQDYFWTSEWQEAEREADEDIKAGRTRRFSTAEELITDLNSSSDYMWEIPPAEEG